MEILIAVGAVVLLIAVFWVMARQPHPADDLEGLDSVDGEEGEGPTGEAYPPGSRPAGPGAESQDPESL
ncbi:MAG TPA: hypothetical protein VHL52_08450 [Acidimicrobiia bacterium]|nr:hypothetical protein [Acidimicrobiia bacterium]